MNKFNMLLAAASLGLLAACGGQGDDTAGNRVAEDAEQAANAMEDQADQMSGAAADQLEAQAEATREAGEQVEEAIDNADVQTNNPAATAAQVEQQVGLPTSADTATDAVETK